MNKNDEKLGGVSGKESMAEVENGAIGKGGVFQKIPRKQNLPAWMVKPLGAESRPLSELSDEELYKKCRDCGQSAKMWSRKFAALLPEVAKRGLHRRKGFVSLHAFAAMVAGMSEYAVDKILQLYAKIKDKPSLLKLFESGAEGWSKIEKVAYVATTETDKLWAEKVTLLSTRALEVLVQNYRARTTHVSETQNELSLSQDGDQQGDERSSLSQFEPPVRFSFPASRDLEFDLRVAKQKMEKEASQTLSWDETFQMMIKKTDFARPKKEICVKCKKGKADFKICEDCSRGLGGGGDLSTAYREKGGGGT